MTIAAPHWWGSLEDVGAELGITWLGPDDWRPAEDLGDDWADSPRTIDVPIRAERDAALRAGKVLVGTGPAVTARLMGIEHSVLWFSDERGALWCALAPYYPAWLWVEVVPTADGLREVLSTTFPRRDLSRVELTGTARGFLGYSSTVQVPNVYSGEFVDVNGHDLDRYLGMSAYPMHGAWGSVHVDDPLRTDIGAVKPLELMAATKGSLTQRLGRVPSMTWRMAQSQAYVSIEIHGRELVCAAVRYVPTPASHQATVARLNTDFGTAYPVDLPLDAIGVLTGFDWDTEETLAANLGPDASVGQVAAMVRVMYALRSGDLGGTLALREYARHPEWDVRLALLRVAGWYGDQFMLYEVLCAEQEPDRRTRIENLIQQGGFGPDTYNAFDDYFSGEPIIVDGAGEPVAAWRDDEDDEDTDDEYDDEEDEA